MIDQSNYNFSTTVSHVTGALLHCLREFEGITQTSLAERTGMSTSGLSKLEKGETNISIEQIFILGGQFKLKSSEFMVLLEDSIELINKKGILVANTKSKVVQIDKTNNVPVVMGVGGAITAAAPRTSIRPTWIAASSARVSAQPQPMSAAITSPRARPSGRSAARFATTCGFANNDLTGARRTSRAVTSSMTVRGLAATDGFFMSAHRGERPCSRKS